MLSKAGNNKPESKEPSLSPEEKADVKIASSMLTQSFLSEEGSQALAKALSTPEPAKAVAMIISQIIEMAQTESQQTDTPLTPTVWLMDGGAIDEAEDDIEAVAEASGIQLPEGFEEALIDEVAVLIERRAAEFQKAPQDGAPSPAPVPGQPMGGAPNGMG